MRYLPLLLCVPLTSCGGFWEAIAPAVKDPEVQAAVTEIAVAGATGQWWAAIYGAASLAGLIATKKASGWVKGRLEQSEPGKII